MHAVLLAYLAGVAVGLWRIDAAPLTRAALALGWPVGVAAAVVTLTLLGAASLVLFPLFGALSAAVVALAWALW